MNDKFVLPNENTEATSNHKIMKYHLKSNYIATINPTRLSSLTFRITNEDNDTVGTSINTTAIDTVDNAAGYKSGATDVVVDDYDGFVVYDAVYNSSHVFVGIITGITINGGGSDTLHFSKGIHVSLFDNESLFLSATTVRSAIQINNSGGYVISTAAALSVDGGTATDVFSVNDKVYLGNGALLGKVSAINAGDITFTDGTKHFVPDNAHLYISNPLPKVFSSNNEQNRMIFEFVFISR
jgi:adhesin HecA-like repeat protein